MASIFDSYGQQSGVSPIYPQDTSVAARQAVQEQKPGDEFNPLPQPDMEMLVKRLNMLRNQQTSMCSRLYGPPNYYSKHDEPYKGPPYLQREMLREELHDVEVEMSAIENQLRALIDQSMLDKKGEKENGDTHA